MAGPAYRQDPRVISRPLSDDRRADEVGLFSTGEIEAGTLILVDTPFLTLTTTGCSSVLEALSALSFDEQKIVMEKLSRLYPRSSNTAATITMATEEQGQEQALLNDVLVRHGLDWGLDKLMAKISWNSMECRNDTDMRRDKEALFHVAPYFNHSCAPNVVRSYVDGAMHFRTLQDVPSDTELSICYFPIEDVRDPKSLRQIMYPEFDCQCFSCLDEDLLVGSGPLRIFDIEQECIHEAMTGSWETVQTYLNALREEAGQPVPPVDNPIIKLLITTLVLPIRMGLRTRLVELIAHKSEESGHLEISLLFNLVACFLVSDETTQLRLRTIIGDALELSEWDPLRQILDTLRCSKLRNIEKGQLIAFDDTCIPFFVHAAILFLKLSSQQLDPVAEEVVYLMEKAARYFVCSLDLNCLSIHIAVFGGDLELFENRWTSKPLLLADFPMAFAALKQSNHNREKRGKNE